MQVVRFSAWNRKITGSRNSIRHGHFLISKIVKCRFLPICTMTILQLEKQKNHNCDRQKPRATRSPKIPASPEAATGMEMKIFDTKKGKFFSSAKYSPLLLGNQPSSFEESSFWSIKNSSSQAWLNEKCRLTKFSNTVIMGARISKIKIRWSRFLKKWKEKTVRFPRG